MLVISTQNWSILAKFAQKNPAKSAVFYWLFLGEVSPRNFPWNRPIFLRICPWKSFKIWLFSTKIPRNWLIFLRILTYLLRKSREIGRFFREFAPENPAKFWFFFREISEALVWVFPIKNWSYITLHKITLHYITIYSYVTFQYPKSRFPLSRTFSVRMHVKFTCLNEI